MRPEIFKIIIKGRTLHYFLLAIKKIILDPLTYSNITTKGVAYPGVLRIDHLIKHLLCVVKNRQLTWNHNNTVDTFKNIQQFFGSCKGVCTPLNFDIHIWKTI